MLHDFDEACHHKERCSKDHPRIIYGKRVGGRFVVYINTAAKPAARAATEVTDKINDNDDIVATVSVKQHA